MLISFKSKQKSVIFPNGKTFAFTIFDDTDQASILKVKPMYDLLYDLGMLTTKSVWVLPTNDPKFWANNGDSLADAPYLEYILELQKKGFEIGLHSIRGGDSKTKEISHSLELFKKLIGHYPYTCAFHAHNKENAYWEQRRIDLSPIKYFYRYKKHPQEFFGHVENSDYFWGESILKHIKYIRNFIFNEINTLKINPSMPYHDKSKPFVNFWFSSSNGKDVNAFNDLLNPKNIDKLERQHGVSIVYTHFAFQFVNNSKINEDTKRLLINISKRNAYIVPVHKMLDLLLDQRNGTQIGWPEKLFIENYWSMQRMLYGSC